jgi:hypothetical protein
MWVKHGKAVHHAWIPRDGAIATNSFEPDPHREMNSIACVNGTSASRHFLGLRPRLAESGFERAVRQHRSERPHQASHRLHALQQ